MFARSAPLNDGYHLIGGTRNVVIDYHEVVRTRKLELLNAVSIRLSISSCVSLPRPSSRRLQLLHIGCLDKHEDRVRASVLDLESPLRVDLKNHLISLADPPLSTGARSVPYRLPWTSAHSRNSPSSTCVSNSSC